MDIIFRGSKPIIEEEDQVQIVKAWDHVCRIRFMDISKYQFENIAEIEFLSAKNTEQTKEYKYQYREIKLFFCKEVDQKVFINFIPFIYQERYSMLTNKLIVYDIYTQQIDGSESINPSQSNKKYLHMDKFGFNNFSISRTTDINEEQDENAKSNGKLLKVKQQAKYQIFTLYTEKLGRYSCQEYIISHSVNGTENITIGQKQLLFS